MENITTKKQSCNRLQRCTKTWKKYVKIHWFYHWKIVFECKNFSKFQSNRKENICVDHCEISLGYDLWKILLQNTSVVGCIIGFDTFDHWEILMGSRKNFTIETLWYSNTNSENQKYRILSFKLLKIVRSISHNWQFIPSNLTSILVSVKVLSYPYGHAGVFWLVAMYQLFCENVYSS